MTQATDFVVLLAGLLRRGVRFKLTDGGKGVRLIPGAGGVTDEEVAELRRCKPTLIRILRALEVTQGRLVHPPRFPMAHDGGDCAWN